MWLSLSNSRLPIKILLCILCFLCCFFFCATISVGPFVQFQNFNWKFSLYLFFSFSIFIFYFCAFVFALLCINVKKLVLGFVMNQIGNIFYPCSFMVLDAPNMEFLFGLDMLRKHQVTYWNACFLVYYKVWELFSNVIFSCSV